MNFNERQVYEKMQPINDTRKFRSALLDHKTLIDRIVNHLRIQNPNMYSTQKIANYSAVLERIGINHSFAPIKTEANGNCLYNAISMILFGNSQNYWMIKLGLGAVFVNHESYVKNIIDTFDDKSEYTKVLFESVRDGAWGNHYHILMLSALLKKPIYVYTDTLSHHKYCVNQKLSFNKPVCILLVSNHFTALMPFHRTSKYVDAKWEQFKNFQLTDI
jgi:hypothetical protein